MKRVIIKEGPLVLIRNIIGVELTVSVLLFVVSYFENYEALFHLYAPITRYDIFLICVFSLLQVSMIFIVFFRWYFSYYELRDREIIRKTGLILRRQRSVLATQILTVGTSQGLVERFMRHGTIVIECAFNMEIRIRNVELFSEYVDMIKHMVDTRTTPAQRIRPLADLLTQGEGGRVEFKQTLRWDIRKKAVSKDVERAIMKTIIGFLNADGGTLIIGVDDDANLTGLEEDFNSLPKKNRDSFENHFTALVKAMIGIKFRSLIHTRFEKVGEDEVCIIDVEPSSKPAYLIGVDGKEEFFVRTGNATNPFTMSEAEEYIAMRWKGRE